MNKTSERGLETLLRSAAFPNHTHKEALRDRLFGDMQELELDELAIAAGGVTADLLHPEDWAKITKEKQT